MSRYEALTLLASVVALAISVTSIIRSRRTEAKQLVLQVEQTRLAELQRSILERQEQQRNQADVRVYASETTDGFRFFITNLGPADARNVYAYITYRLDDGFPVDDNEIASKLPVAVMRAGEEISLRIASDLSKQMEFQAKAVWETVDGKKQSAQFELSL